ncbi:MAG: HIT domain-containing protein [bacterium]|nr:HIT domain-containing protein [bacterium]
MKFLSAPWRWDFITRAIRKKECVFCTAPGLPEEENLVCHRGRNFFVILNKYPYNSGHLMVVPYKHVDSPDAISAEESMEMWTLMNRSMAILKESFNPVAFNTGMNLGKIAGAGVKDHIHLHIVPRWEGDANFMPIIGKTEVLSYDIITIRDTLRNGFKK